jgi:AcrR family transcriptional regulator
MASTTDKQQPQAGPTRPGSRRTQRERSEQSAKLLLQAAIELIAEKGFERTTVAEIGERAGYSRLMVRARYGSKEALLESIFSAELDRRLMPPTDEELRGLAWVLARVDHVATLLEQERELMLALSVMSLEAGIGITTLRSWYTTWFAEYERQIARHLREGQSDGDVRAGIDPEAEAAQFVLTGLGSIFRWTLAPDEFDLAGTFNVWRARLERAYSAR